MTKYDAFFSRIAETMQGSAIRKMGQMAASADIISFAPGYPAPDTFAWQDFARIAARLLESREASVLQYGPTRGYGPLVKALPEILDERGISAQADEVLVTTGSQQGLDLVAEVLVDPGDVVLVELPAYTGAITAFRKGQARLAGVRQEADGIDLVDLDAVLERERSAGRRVRLLYVVPNFQNPTGLLIGREKRKLLLEWASRKEMLIIEDDPYGSLYFPDVASAEDARPIKADDVEGRVVYLTSFSKTLAPGFRVAYIAAPASIVAKLEIAKQAADLCTGSMDQRLVYEAWKEGVLARQVPLLRRHYQQKRDVMQQTLRAELGDSVSWPAPSGGFFLWVALPQHLSADAMLPRAIAQRVIYVVGSAFFVDGSGANLMRLSFSAPSPDTIVDGVKRLAGVIKEEMRKEPEPVAG
jgi:2-aminoadipate transaminase